MTTPIRTTDMSTQWLIRQLLIDLGEDPHREGLKETPRRFFSMLKEMTGGYQLGGEDRADQLKRLFEATFTEPYDELIVVRGIEVTSLCEHHMLPFQGHVHVGYLPNGKVLGLSKFARVVDFFAKRLQVQERLTEQVADAIQSHLKPKGVGVIVEAEHLCLKIRGVKKQDPVMTTSSLQGLFRTDACVKKEFFDLVYRR